MGNFQQFWSTTKRNVLLLSSSIWNWLSKKGHYLVPCDSLRKIIIQLHLQLTIGGKTLSSSFRLPGEDYYPAPFAIEFLGEDIIQLHLELTLWRSTLSSFFWLSGEEYYPAPSTIDSLGENIIQLFLTLWGKTLSSSIWNWLSEGRHYPVPCDFLRKIIIQLHLQLTMGGWHYPALSDSLGKIIIQLYLLYIIQLYLELTLCHFSEQRESIRPINILWVSKS